MIPILVTQFSQAGLGLIDTIMAGRLSPVDLAAIAVGVGLWIPVMLLFSGIMIATTPLVAEANGARVLRQVCNAGTQSLRIRRLASEVWSLVRRFWARSQLQSIDLVVRGTSIGMRPHQKEIPD